jgi:hypothetical protein
VDGWLKTIKLDRYSEVIKEEGYDEMKFLEDVGLLCAGMILLHLWVLLGSGSSSSAICPMDACCPADLSTSAGLDCDDRTQHTLVLDYDDRMQHTLVQILPRPIEKM